MKKCFVVRPHVLLSSHRSTLRFGNDNLIVIPTVVLDEINGMKDLTHEKAKIRRSVLEYIESLGEKVFSEEGCVQENGSILRVVDTPSYLTIDVEGLTEYQRNTFKVCKGIAAQNPGIQVVLVTNNVPLRMKARKIGITAERFKDEIFPPLEKQYRGRFDIDISAEVKDILYSKRKISADEIKKFSEEEFLENSLFTLRCGSYMVTGILREGNIEMQEHWQKCPYGVVPKNEGQKLLINALYDEAPLVVVKGPPGTGKTLLSMAVALERTESGEFDGILITRTVSNDSLGYLPGNVDEKLSPFLQGIKDNLEILIGNSSKGSQKSKGGKRAKHSDYDDYDKNDQVERGEYFFEQGIIKIQAVEMLRGRSIVRRIFIIDETQNIDPEDIKTIVTRAGEGSKFIFLGDPSQVDNPKLTERNNGIVYLAEMMKGDPDCIVLSLDDEESVRSRLARSASRIL